MDALSHFSIGLVLFFFARKRVAIYVEKLGPIQADPFRAVGRDRFDVIGQFDVG